MAQKEMIEGHEETEKNSKVSEIHGQLPISEHSITEGRERKRDEGSVFA